MDKPQDNQEKPVTQQIPVTSRSSNFSKLILALISVVVLIVVGVVSYMLGLRNVKPVSQSQMTVNHTVSQPSSSPSPISQVPMTPKQNVIIITPTTDANTHWNTYTIANLGLQFSLPPQIYAGQGDFKEAIGNGQSGTEFCIYFSQAEIASNNNKSGGQCWTNEKDIFVMGADSVDFEAGRSGTFMDTLGFTQKGSVFSENLNLNRKMDLTSYQPQKVDNMNGVSIIKIKGVSSDPQNPYSGIGETLSNSWLGALVNTKKTDYPGIGLQIRLVNGITESLFDQILFTFKLR